MFFSSSRGRIWTVSVLWVSAPVGHTAAHSPQETQVLSPIGASMSNEIREP
jgi:hypothetical protein